jgi:hypothetical protein
MNTKPQTLSAVELKIQKPDFADFNPLSLALFKNMYDERYTIHTEQSNKIQFKFNSQSHSEHRPGILKGSTEKDTNT